MRCNRFWRGARKDRGWKPQCDPMAHQRAGRGGGRSTRILPLPGPACSLSPSSSVGPPVSPPGARAPPARLLLPPPRPPPLAVWQRRSGCGGGRGALATRLLPCLPPPPRAWPEPPLPLPQPRTRRRRFPSGLRGRSQDGGRGAGRVGGVKVGARQNPPRRAQCGQTARSDLRTGGRAGPRRYVDQSSPDPHGHAGNPSVVSLQPWTQESPPRPHSLSPGMRPAPETPAPRVPRAPLPACPRPSHDLPWSCIRSTHAASLRPASPRMGAPGP